MPEDKNEEQQGGQPPDRVEQEPLGEPPIFNAPASILVLLALFALVHGLRQVLTPEQDLAFLLRMAFIPARYMEGFGSDIWSVTSLVTYNFLHGDLVHLGINSIWMLAMGSAVAKRVGSLRFFLFSLICGMFAAFAHLLAHFGEVAPVIGASGAISGQMAAAIRFVFSVDPSYEGSRQLRDDLRAIPLQGLGRALRDGRVIAVLVIFITTNVLTGMGMLGLGDESAPIAWEAHIGGFVAGLALFGLFDRADHAGAKRADDEGHEEPDAGPWD